MSCDIFSKLSAICCISSCEVILSGSGSCAGSKQSICSDMIRTGAMIRLRIRINSAANAAKSAPVTGTMR